MFIWFGRKGFMRGPVWFLFFIFSIISIPAGAYAVASGASEINVIGTILMIIGAVLYVIAYIFLPRWWQKKNIYHAGYDAGE